MQRILFEEPFSATGFNSDEAMQTVIYKHLTITLICMIALESSSLFCNLLSQDIKYNISQTVNIKTR
jgi:hypothetical protein